MTETHSARRRYWLLFVEMLWDDPVAGRILRWWEGATLRERIGAVGVSFVVLLAVAVGLSLYSQNQWEPRALYSDLSPDRAQEVRAKLDSLDIPYSFSDDGQMVLVPSDLRSPLRRAFETGDFRRIEPVVLDVEALADPALLFVDLDPAEGVEIAGQLAELSVQYALSSDSSIVAVPMDALDSLRLEFARRGHPESGRIGYDVHEEADLSVSAFLNRSDFVRQVELELEQTLYSIGPVRRARVSISLPDMTPGLGQTEQSTASVALTLEPFARLSEAQVQSIVALVSLSVRELEPEHVVVVDDSGNLLSDSDLSDSVFGRSGRTGYLPYLQALLAQTDVERLIERRVGEALDRVLGTGRWKLRVTARLGSANTPNGYPVRNDIRPLLRSRSLERLSMALTVDETKVVIDPQTYRISEIIRPQEEIEAAATIASQVALLQPDRGDELTVFAMPFDKTQEIQARKDAIATERRDFWTGVAINVAKVLGILAALITLRFLIQAIGKGVGVEDIDGVVARALSDESPEERQAEEDRRLAAESLVNRYSRELETARAMQMDLMPALPPRIDGYDVAGLCRPASQVGGDFYQYFALSDDRWLLCTADVTGHGMEAAIPVVMFSGVLKSQMGERGSASDLLHRLNTTMHGSVTGATLTRRTFVCFSACELHVPSGRVQMANGGCPFPFHFRAGNDDIAEVEVGGYPLGVRPSSRYQQLEARMEPGDRVVLCTDGFIEATDSKGNMFGFERAAYAIRSGCRRGLSAEDLVHHLVREVERFTGDVEQQDDQTLVVLQAT